MARLLLDEIFSRDIDTVPLDSPHYVRLAYVESELRASVIDVLVQLSICDKSRSKYKFWSDLKQRGYEVTKHQFAGPGERQIPVMTYQGFLGMIPDAISFRQIPFYKKQAMLAGFNVDYTKPRVYIRTRAEDDIHGDLVKALGGCLQIDLQYGVGSYRVDMHVHELNVVVECDEGDHSAYDAEFEMARQEFITKELGCRWVRYNPYAADFDVFAIISRILNSADIVCTSRGSSSSGVTP
jgi:very-short-patch-repair endonuclease